MRNTNDKRLGFGSFYLPRWRITCKKNKETSANAFLTYNMDSRTTHGRGGGCLPRAISVWLCSGSNKRGCLFKHSNYPGWVSVDATSAAQGAHVLNHHNCDHRSEANLTLVTKFVSSHIGKRRGRGGCNGKEGPCASLTLPTVCLQQHSLQCRRVQHRPGHSFDTQYLCVQNSTFWAVGKQR